MGAILFVSVCVKSRETPISIHEKLQYLSSCLVVPQSVGQSQTRTAKRSILALQIVHVTSHSVNTILATIQEQFQAKMPRGVTESHPFLCHVLKWSMASCKQMSLKPEGEVVLGW